MKKTETTPKEKPKILWIKCTTCDHILYKKDLYENFKICPKCGAYLRMSARERISMLADPDAEGHPQFKELDSALAPQDPLEFSDPQAHSAGGAKAHGKDKGGYAHKLATEQKKTGHPDAVLCGEATVGGHAAVLAVMDFDFMGGSMGSVVGEKVTRAAERALEKKVPLILVSASGGARMQEGVLSLMQMAKTSAAIARLHAAGVFVLSILCDPTTGGVTASFATLGDVLMAEPRALIAFAGPRVIEQTLRQKLPEGFQQSEFLLKHGMLDCIVERKDLKARAAQFLDFFARKD